MDFDRGTATVGGLELAYLSTGPADGPLALCLHGFPDSAWTWRLLMPELAAAGFRAVAPFMRGYAPSGIPEDGAYQTGALVADACGLHEALGADERAVIIGHDWGALATYGAASFTPDRWRRVVTAAVPPSGALGAGFLSYDQLRRSWYMFFFQNPLSDIAVAMNDLAFIDRLWADWSPGYDAGQDLTLLKESMRAQPNLAAALGYYRAQWGGAPAPPELAAQQAAVGAKPPQPTLYLHGRQDGCMGADLAEGALAFLSEGSQLEIVEGAGHFLHLERPAEVNERVLEFVTA